MTREDAQQEARDMPTWQLIAQVNHMTYGGYHDNQQCAAAHELASRVLRVQEILV